MKILQNCRVHMIGGTHIFQINGVGSVIKIWKFQKGDKKQRLFFRPTNIRSCSTIYSR